MPPRSVLLALALLLLSSTAVPAGEFPYVSHVVRDEVQARSGPGRNYYATSTLYEGDTVEVYRHDPGGWCAVRPPRGSFSWVLADQVRLIDGETAVIEVAEVPARVGTDHGDTRDVIQVRLEHGEEVAVIEAQRFGSGPDAVTWYKIAPPPGEFRWVKREDLREPREDDPRETDADEPADDDESQDDAQEHNLGAEGDAHDAADEPADEAEHFEDPVDQLEGDAEATADDGDESDFDDEAPEPRPRRSRSRDHETDESDERDRETSDHRARRQHDEPAADEDRYERQYDEPSEEELDDDDSNRAEDDFRDDEVEAAQYLTPADRSRTRRAAMRAESDARRIAARAKRAEDEHRTASRERVRPALDSTAGDVEGDHELADLPPSAALEEIDLALASMVSEEPDAWRLAPLKVRAEELLATASTALERGRARLLLGRIERFEDIERRYRSLESSQEHLARRRAQLDRVRDRGSEYSYASQPAANPDSPARYDGTGRLAQIDSNRPSGPSYALVDSAGRVRSYVTPAPGVNLRHYLGQTVGVTGTQGYLPELDRHHVTARRITVLDGRWQ